MSDIKAKLPEKADAKALANIVRNHITIVDGIVKIEDEKKLVQEMFDTTEIDEKTAKRVYDIVASMGNGFAGAVGEAAIEYMAAHKDYDKVVGNIHIGHEQVTVTSTRSKTFRNMQTNENFEKKGTIRRARLLTNGDAELQDFKDYLANLPGLKEL